MVLFAFRHPAMFEDFPHGAREAVPVIFDIEEGIAGWALDMDFVDGEGCLAIGIDALLVCVVGHDGVVSVMYFGILSVWMKWGA